MNKPKNTQPPLWILRFFRWFCHPDYQEDIEGDLLEKFARRVEAEKRPKANWLFFREVLSLFRPALIKPFPANHLIIYLEMFANYFKIAFRTIAKSRVFSLIHILGLTIGVAVCLLIFQYVNFEKSYDAFHENGDNLYRVPLITQKNAEPPRKVAANHPGLGPAMQADFPEVEAFTRVLNPANIGINPMVSYINSAGSKISYTEEKLFIADSTFFSLFSFPLISGNSKTLLTKPRSIVLSASSAKKYFGKEDPLGKTLQINGTPDWTVTGVFEDMPENSHLQASALVSLSTLGNFGEIQLWRWPEYHTYVLLKDGQDPKAIEAKFPTFAEQYVADVRREFGINTSFLMEPIRDIHLQSDSSREFESPGNQRSVYFLTLIAIFILGIAWLNYINLATAKSIERAKEVGLRKVMGAYRHQLVGQFLSEAFIINSVSILLGFLLAILLLPSFEQLIGKNIGNSLLSVGLLTQPMFWLAIVGILLISSVLTGFYPALILSAFQPVQVLKSKLYSSKNTATFRKLLVGLQFTLSIGLIAATLIVLFQLSFMSNQELGYEQDQILVIKAPMDVDSTYSSKIGVLKSKLLQSATISSFTASSNVPGEEIDGRNGIRRRGQDSKKDVPTFLESIDAGHIATFEMKLLAGTSFSTSDSTTIFGADNNKILINKKLMRLLEFAHPEDAIGEMLVFKYGNGEHEARVIGVVDNYHQRSLMEDYDPIMYYYPSFDNWKYFSLKASSTDWSQTLSHTKESYAQIFTGNPFEYFFLNEFFDRQYRAEQRFGKVFKIFSFLAIFVTCLGFFGLSTLILSRRRKEIGVRKVLGATAGQVLYLLSSSFLKILLIAYLIAIPIVVYFAKQWLDNFAFQVGLKWPIFVIPLLLLSVVILLIVGIQLLRSASLNPVVSLKET